MCEQKRRFFGHKSKVECQTNANALLNVWSLGAGHSKARRCSLKPDLIARPRSVREPYIVLNHHVASGVTSSVHVFRVRTERSPGLALSHPTGFSTASKSTFPSPLGYIKSIRSTPTASGISFSSVSIADHPGLSRARRSARREKADRDAQIHVSTRLRAENSYG